ncbi:MAG TPA: MCE family protein [Pseudonocardiaceae bacterium]|jgi:phospholipid/cholesterol/gamma-HCH transport system substrate-binding protein|nr:MCE family protein [Pseudonocardiaceae bacterium]
MRVPWAALTKLAAFTLVTVVATGVLTMTVANTTLSPRVGYLARFTDVSGLAVGDDVRIAGVRVGSVQSIELVERRIAQVGFAVDTGVRIPASVTAAVLYRNLIGQRYLALGRGPGPPGRELEPGGLIPLARTTPPLDLTVLFHGFAPLLAGLDPEQVNRLSFEIVQVLQGQGGTVQSLLAHTSALTRELADRDRVLGEVITNLNAVLDTVTARDEQLAALVVQLQRLVSGLAADRVALGQAVSSLGQLADTTAGLVGEARPALRADIAALGQLSTTLADHHQVLDGVLGYLPEKLTTLSRAASYGSWFNFYLCGLEGTVPGVGAPVVPLTSPPPAARCRP